MRITNSMLVSNFLGDLNGNMSRVAKLQDQMASGNKYAHVSDDPVSVIYAQQAQHRINRIQDYQRNVDTAGEWLTMVESGVMELNELMKSAYEACIDAATDVKGDKDKANVAEYVGQLRDQVLQSLNTTYGTKHVFGGYATTGYTDASGDTQNPFTLDGGNLCYNGIDVGNPSAAPGNVLTFDVGLGIDIEVTVSGVELANFKSEGVDMNLYSVLDNLYKALKGETNDEIDGFIKPLQDAQDHLLGIAAEIGGKTNRLELLASRYSQDELNYIQMLSDAKDADYAEVLMNFKMAESIYNASLSAGASIIQPTLMDFLR